MCENWKPDEKDIYEIRVLNNQVKTINAIFECRGEDYVMNNRCSQQVEDAIKNFNYAQKYNAIHREPISGKSELVDYYVKNFQIIKVEKITRKTKTNHFGLKYYRTCLDFSDLCQANKVDDVDYRGFKHLVDTIAYYMVENMECGQYPPCNIHSRKKNIYKAWNTSNIVGRNIGREDIKSHTKIKDLLNEGIRNAFNFYKFILNKGIIKYVIEAGIFNRHRPDTIINLIFSEYAIRVNEISRSVFTPRSVTKHVAWCKHENKRHCELLDEECHSSFGCILYESNK